MKELKKLYNKQKQLSLQYLKANQEFENFFIDEAVSKAKSAFLSYYNLKEGDVIILREGLSNDGNNTGKVSGKLFFKDSQLIELATSYFNNNLRFVYEMFETKDKIAVKSIGTTYYEMHDINSFIDSMIIALFINQFFLHVENNGIEVAMSSVKEYDKFTGFVKDF